MRICVVGTRGFPNVEGGVEKHCESIYPLLAEHMEVIAFRRKPYVNGTETYKNIRFVDLPSTKIKGFEAVLHSFFATVTAIWMRPDVVHFHNIGPGLFIPLVKLFHIPVVLTYHSPNYEHKKWGYFSRKLLHFCENVALHFADKIIFVNKFQMQKYGEKVQSKAVYIPNGIQELQRSCCLDYLDELGVMPGKYVLSVGRITPEKGFHTLIEAFTKQQCADYKLVIAGGVEFESEYMKQLRMLGNNAPVVFTGYVCGEPLAQLYSNAALFVLASENEGFPLVLLEAMQYGRDVLVSDIPGTHLIPLEMDDYFTMGEVAELSEKMTRKLQNPISRVYNLEGYNWNEIADRVRNLMIELVGNT